MRTYHSRSNQSRLWGSSGVSSPCSEACRKAMLLPAVCKHDLMSQLQPIWWHYTAKQLLFFEEVNLMSRQFDVFVERDSEGFFVATVPALPGCHTQAKSLDQ